MFFDSNMAFQTQTLSLEQRQALFESITAQQSQGSSSFHLPHLRPDQQGETPLDTQTVKLVRTNGAKDIIIKQPRG